MRCGHQRGTKFYLINTFTRMHYTNQDKDVGPLDAFWIGPMDGDFGTSSGGPGSGMDSYPTPHSWADVTGKFGLDLMVSFSGIRVDPIDLDRTPGGS